MDETIVVKCSSGREIKPEYVECHGVFRVPIYEKGKMIGKAILLHSVWREELILEDIIVYDESLRRRGAGDDMMRYMTENYPLMITGKSRKAGRELCLKHGWTLEQDLKGRYGLLFRKEGLDESSEPTAAGVENLKTRKEVEA